MFANCIEELNFRKLRIPPFEIGKGDVLFLDWPRLPNGDEELQFLSALRHEHVAFGLTVQTKATVANPIDADIQKMLVSEIPEVDKLLEMVDGAVRERFGTQISEPLCNLPATLRAVVAVHLACYKSSFVIFNSSGLDYLGEEALLEFVCKKALKGWGFLCFNFPLFSNKARDTDIVGVSKHHCEGKVHT